MKVDKELAGNNHVKLAIKLTSSEWEATLDKAATKVSEGLKIDGFRAGKAPREVVIAKAGEARVVSEAIELAVEEFYPVAARQENIRPIAFPKVSVEKGSLTEPLEFSAEVAVLPEVVLGDYSKLKVNKTVEPVTDEQVDGILKNMQKKAVEFTEVERAAAMGDWTEIDFDGFIDGKAFEGGSSKKHPLIIGDKVFIPGFEEGLIGMGVGEEKEIEVTFPKDYHKEDLAGKPVKFKVKMLQVKAVKYPDIDDAFAKKAAGLDTLEALKTDIRKFMVEEAERKANEQVREDAVMALVKLAKVDLPTELVDQELDGMLHDLKHQAEASGMSFDDYLKRGGATEEKVRNDWREQAEHRVRAGLALEAFRNQEKIDANDEEVAAEIEKLKKMYPEEVEKINTEYSKGRGRDRLRQMLASRKAIDYLVELATK
ncbi:MAG: trigger factor [bacterium]